jgi:hypothetical protein
MVIKGWRYICLSLKSKFLGSKIYWNYGKFVAWLEYRSIRKRLLNEGHSEIMMIRIMIRFLNFKKYKMIKGSKAAVQKVYKLIAETSDQTGIPQWELRAMLEHDFGLEL